ncbi:MAG: lipopolysaccharide transport system permease protein [Blastocatellia bacterium]|jgi:lipopolysaccharide transport system permease protein|nr:lipopolysaccharide transport system permease protein [Blastocatellia bacterium]
MELPNEPLVVIQPSKSWVALNLRDLWSYRELLYFLTWRDVKVRYKQTLLGVAWAVMQPLFTMLIFTLFFGKLGGFDTRTEGMPYPLFAFAGLLPWTFFANAVTNSSNSLVGSANLITKVYFPRMIIPGAAVAAGLVDFAISFVMLVGLMFYYKVAVTATLLLLPVLVILTAALAVGVGMWLSALNVKYRDIRFALPFLIQLWMFMSPIIFPTTFLPPKWRWAMALNPLTGIIEGYRSSIFGRPVDWSALGISTLIIVLLVVYASYSFRRMEKTFADIV